LSDPTSFQTGQDYVADLRENIFLPLSVTPPDQWAEQYLRIPGEHGSTSPWSFDFFPPQREMFLELFNPRNRKVVFKLGSRLAKTWTVLAAIGYCIKESPRKIGVMWPTISSSEHFSKRHLVGELAASNPQIFAVLTDATGRRLSSNTILQKTFPGGLISMFGANVPGDLRRFKGNFLYADEIDAISSTETDEGDQLKQLEVRGSEYPDTVVVLSSYPSLKGFSLIDREYEASDQRVWCVICPECDFSDWVMHRRDLRYDKDAPEAARIECPQCHHLHTDAARYQMSQEGRWSPRQEFRGIAGFHANAMLWPHPVDRNKFPGGFLQMLALEEIAAENSDNPERAKRVIVNTRDAESYQSEHLQKIEHSVLYKRREDYDPRVVLPEEVVRITAGVDVQANRVEIKFKAWGFRNGVKQSWGVEYRIVRGSPLQAELWEKLENVLRNVAWKHPSGQYIRPSIVLIDSSYRPDEVYGFCRRMQKHGVYACEGAEQLGKAIVEKRWIKRGSPPALVREIGTHEAKDIIYQQLEITDPAAQGYNHYPAIACFDEGYFQGLTIEESEMRKAARDGEFYRFFFKKSSDDRNEPLDCEVYANAAEQIHRPNYEKLLAQFSGEPEDEQPLPGPDYNPDRFLPVARPRFNKSGSRWMAGFRR
jgi:phage terminase large subunit GpA-like protein